MALDTDDLLKSHRDYYGGYHHHKEQMAYAATILYLSGTFWLARNARQLFETDRHPVLLLLLILVGAASGWLFVIWQLRNRQTAADIVAACTNLLSRRLNAQDQDFIKTPVLFASVKFPHSLVDEITKVQQHTRWLGGPRWSNFITYSIMVTWTVLVGIRLLTP